MNVLGSGFNSNSAITWNGTTLSTVLVVAGQLSATIPASFIATQGSASVDVTPGPGQTSPPPLTFTITPPALTLTSLNPTSAFAGGPAFPLTVNGSGFTANTFITWNGSSLSTKFVSAGQLTATVPANFITTVGTASVGVAAPGQISPTPLAFTITQAPLTLTNINPTSAVAGGPSFPLTVNGSGFTANTFITWNGSSLATNFVSAGQLTATVPASFIATAGSASVGVSAPGQPSPRRYHSRSTRL